MLRSTRTFPILAASASALTLAACATVGPNFKAPEGPKGAAASGYAMAGDAAAPGVTLTATVLNAAAALPDDLAHGARITMAWPDSAVHDLTSETKRSEHQ